MILGTPTRSKIESFFRNDEAHSVMEIAGKEYEKALDKIHDEFMYRFREYLVDEYSLFYEECVRDGIIKNVSALLLGDLKVLERFNLAPADWGLRCDPDQIRRKIVEANQDIIGSTYIQSLEEQVARLQDDLEFHRNKGW